MEEPTPNWDGIGLEEQKHLKSRGYMLHFIGQGDPTTTPLAGHSVKQSAALAFSKNPLLIRREEKQQQPFSKETGKDEIWQ